MKPLHFYMKHYKGILDYARVKIDKRNHIEANQEEEEQEKDEEKSNWSKARKPKLCGKNYNMLCQIWQLAPQICRDLEE